ncbi:hypothetical protein H2866_22490 [Rouxiella badensis subsp. acadiensis]|nr:hypothetical protein H2866_22490 [Rouxiella badensis subsp. acadiensis]
MQPWCSRTNLAKPVECQRQRDKIALQMAGVEKLEGTYPFTQARSLKALRINRFLHRLIQPAWRERFLSEQQAMFDENKLTTMNNR